MMKNKKFSYTIQLFLLLLIILIISNIKIYIIKTGSMEPSLRINEMIIVRKRRKNTEYLVGDIITYIDRETGTTITHRIADVIDDKIYTKGDYNNCMDINYIKYDDIIFHNITNASIDIQLCIKKRNRINIRFRFQKGYKSESTNWT